MKPYYETELGKLSTSLPKESDAERTESASAVEIVRLRRFRFFGGRRRREIAKLGNATHEFGQPGMIAKSLRCEHNSNCIGSVHPTTDQEHVITWDRRVKTKCYGLIPPKPISKPPVRPGGFFCPLAGLALALGQLTKYLKARGTKITALIKMDIGKSAIRSCEGAL